VITHESNIEVEDIEDRLWLKLHDVMRDLAFYILENDSGASSAKQLYLLSRSKFGRIPTRVGNSIESSETVVAMEQVGKIT